MDDKGRAKSHPRFVLEPRKKHLVVGEKRDDFRFHPGFRPVLNQSHQLVLEVRCNLNQLYTVVHQASLSFFGVKFFEVESG